MSSATATSTRENVLYEKKGAIAYVTLNRPKVLNALNKATIAELIEVFEDARDDAAVRGVILTGAGDKAFAAGADISEMANDTPTEAEDKTRQRATPHHTHRKPRQAGHRGRQRLRLGRRLRAGDGLHDPTGRRDREVRPAGGDDRHHPGLRGNATPAPAGRQRPGAAIDSHRRHDRRTGSLPDRPGQRNRCRATTSFRGRKPS